MRTILIGLCISTFGFFAANAQDCPNGDTEFWDFADIEGAGTGAPNPSPHDAVNAQGYTAQGAILTLAGAPVLNGGATLDEYFVDDVHLNGNFAVRTGVDMPFGVGGGPLPSDANLVQTWNLSQPVNDLAIFINDVDGQDVAVINGSLNGTIVQLTPADFTFANATPCPSFVGNNTFQSTTCSAADNTDQGGIFITFPGFVDQLEIIYYDPNAGGGGSFSVDFTTICSLSPATGDMALTKTDPVPPVIRPGSNVTFNVTVFNQGTNTVQDVLVADYIPFGFLLNDPAWLQSGNQATTTIPGPIAPGDSVVVPITLQASGLTPEDECPDGESTFWDFADIAGAGIGTNPAPDVAVNDQMYTAQGAVVTLLPPVLNGSATIDEYFVDDVHLNGNFAVRTGVNISGAGGGPNPNQDNLVQTWCFDRPIANNTIRINDVDGQDVAVINASFNGNLITLTTNDFTYVNPTPCPTYLGANTFQSTCAGAPDNSTLGAIDITFPGYMDKLEIIYYDPNPFGGGSFSVNFLEVCDTPFVDDCPFTNYAEVVFFADTNGIPLNDIDSNDDLGPAADSNEVDDAINDPNDHDDLDFAVVQVNKTDFDVALTKSDATPAVIVPGGTATFTLTVTNQSFGLFPDLEDVVISEYPPIGWTVNAGLSSPGWVGNTFVINSLPDGATTNITVVYNVPSGETAGILTNYAEVVSISDTNDVVVDVDSDPILGAGGDTNEVDDAVDDPADHDDLDPGTALIGQPGISLLKTVAAGAGPCPGSELVLGLNGDAVTYCFVVENTGTVTLANVELSDFDISPFLIVTIGTMAPGAVTNISVASTINGNLTNLAEVAGQPATDDGTPIPNVDAVEAEDTAAVVEVAPSISLNKTVYLGHDGGASCPGTELTSGVVNDDVTYCFVVTNTGDTVLTSVTVSDTDLTPNVNISIGTLAIGAVTTVFVEASLTMDLTNTASVGGIPSDAAGTPITGLDAVEDEDTAVVDLIEPSISLAKTVYLGQDGGASCPGTELVTGTTGDLITYCFIITNTGDTTLSSVQITDPLLGATIAVPNLAPGGTSVQFFNSTLTTDLTNTAAVAGTPSDAGGTPLPGVDPVQDADTAAVDLVTPSISLAKSVYLGQDGGASCPGTELVIGTTGDLITYCFIVTNTGDTTLSSVQITDPILGATISVPNLAPGGTSVQFFNSTLTTDLTNTANVAGAPSFADGTPIPDEPNVTDEDTAAVDLVAPAITLEKTVFLGNAGSCPGQELVTGSIGDVVTYCFIVTNTGDVTLSSVVITDPLLGATINVNNLAPGQSSTESFQSTITADLTNTATVAGDPSFPDGAPIPDEPNVTDTNTAAVDLVAPSISIAKSVYLGQDGGASCPGTELATGTTGDLITYCFIVTNTGDVTLSGVVITDPLLGLSINVPNLAPGGTSVQFANSSITADLINTAAVVGVPSFPDGTPIPDETNVTDDDPAEVDLVAPSISLSKTVYLDHDGGASCPGVELVTGTAGDDVTYCFVVTNTGDVTLSSVVITDPLLGASINVPNLAPGGTSVQFFDSTITADLTNTASVAGDPSFPDGTPIPDEPNVTDTNTAAVDLVAPSISIAKSVYLGQDGGVSCPGSELVTGTSGDLITYCFVVTNTGDVTLSSVVITDPLLGLSINVPNLAPGGTSVQFANSTIDGDLVNTAAVAGDPSFPDGTPIPGEPNVTDDDPAEVDEVNPSIVIEKTVYLGQDGGASCQGSEVVTGTTGDLITYCFRVRNNGDVTLSSVVITDPLLGISINVPNLAPNQISTQFANSTLTADLTNTAAVAGDPSFPDGTPIPDEPNVIDDDPAMVDLVAPSISINKTVYLGHDGGAGCPGGELSVGTAGEEVTYCFVITNTGDTTLSSVEFTDPSLTGPPPPLSLPYETLVASSTGTLGTGGLDFSGATFNDDRTRLLVVDNGANEIYEFDVDAAGDIVLPVRRVISFNVGAGDLEGIAWMGGDRYAILSENDAAVYIVDIPDAANVTTLNNGNVVSSFATGIPEIGGFGNEGIAVDFNASAGGPTIFWVLDEGPTPRLYRFDELGNQTANIVIPGISDASGVFVSSMDDTIFIVSDESTSITQFEVDAAFTTLTPLSTQSISEFEQAEGITFSADMSSLYVVGEAPTGQFSYAHYQDLPPPTGLTVSVPNLAPGEVFTSFFDATIDGDLTNTASVTGDPSFPDGTPIDDEPLVEDDDTAVVDEVNPSITIAKTVFLGNTDSCPGDELVTGTAGDIVTYCFIVTNTGDITLSSVVITDPLLGITLSIPNLAPGADYTESFQSTIMGDLTNTASVTGDPAFPDGTPIPDEPNVTDDDTAAVDEVNPSISIAKSVYLDHDVGASCPGAELVTGTAGDAITYCFIVTNTGDVTLSGVEITDPLLGLTIAVPNLAPGGTSVQFANALIAGDLTNTAMVTGDPSFPDGTPIPDEPDVTDDDPAMVDEVNPSITIAKSVYLGQDGGASCPGDELVTGTMGDLITYCFIVTNTGDVTLSSVVITDPQLNISINVPNLAPGDVSTQFVNDTIDGDLMNTASVAGDPSFPDGTPIPGEPNVTDDDTAAVDEVNPSISIAKSVYLGTDGGASCPGSELVTGTAGDAITYCFIVTNTGDVTLSSVVITDPLLGANISVPNLAPGDVSVQFLDSTIMGDLTNTASVAGDPSFPDGTPIPDEPSVTDDDTAAVDEVNPSISIAKSVYLGTDSGASCPGSELVTGTAGDAITYCFIVTNTGDVTLSSVVITDPLLGANISVPNLAPGDVSVQFLDSTIMGDLTNTASVAGDPSFPDGTPIPDEPNVTDDDTAAVDEVNPSITIAKSVYLGTDGGASCPGDELVTGTSGDAITYCFIVTNTGDVTLSSVEITDSDISPPVTISVSNLAPSAVSVQFVDSTIQGDLLNTASVTGDPSFPDGTPIPDEPNVTDDDTAEVDQVGPGIQILKTVYLGQDGGASCPGTELATGTAGDLVTYCFIVTNSGDVTLSSIEITDPLLSATISVPNLAPGATSVQFFNSTIDGDLLNTAAVTGDPSFPDGTPIPDEPNVTDDDTAAVDEVNPSISIAKSVYLDHDAGASCPGTELVTGTSGDAVTYCFVVTNTGDVTLSGIMISDPLLGVTIAVSNLAPGEVSVEFANEVINGDLLNTATVSGDPSFPDGTPIPDEPNVTDEDTAEVDEVNPSISLSKTVYLGQDGGASCPGVDLVTGTAGDLVTYCFIVTNTGDVTLSGVEITDPLLGATIAVPNLAPGGTSVQFFNSTIDGDLINTATVTGDPSFPDGTPIPDEPDVTDGDIAEVDEVNPSISIAKSVYLGQDGGASCPGVELVTGTTGDLITYCFIVTNTGDVTLSGVEITDSLLGATIAVSNLAPGAVSVQFLDSTIAGDLLNTAMVTGDPSFPDGTPIPDEPDVTDDDTAEVDEVNPSITLAKSVYLGHDGGASCPGIELVTGTSGDEITYCFIVTNTGDVTLSSVEITDSLLGLTIAVPNLAPGGTSVQFVESAIAANLLNTASVTGDPSFPDGTPIPDEPDVTDDDTAEVDQVGPGIQILKTVYLGQDGGASCPGTELAVGQNGDLVTYCFIVTNSGDVTLSSVVITDTDLGLSIPVANLAPGAFSIEFANATIDGDLTNTASVVGDPSFPDGSPIPGEPNVTDDDTAEVDEIAPSISIAKSVYLGHDSGASCPGGELAVAQNGDLVTYCMVVTNTGDTVLTSVTVTDPLLGLTAALGTLAPGAVTNIFLESAIAGDLVNTASVTGQPSDDGGNPIPSEDPVTDDDTAEVDEVAPSISIAKSVYLGHNSGASCPGDELAVGQNGDPVTYCFIVTNTGDTVLTGVVVNDGDISPPLSIPIGTLAPGAVTNIFFNGTIDGDLVNSANVTGQPADDTGNPLPGQDPVMDDDTAEVDEVAPSISIAKSVYLGHDSGASCPGDELAVGVTGTAVTYCMLVTNTGDTVLTSVTISDPLLGVSVNVGTLAPGAVTNIFAETTITSDLINTADVSGQPSDAAGNPLPGQDPVVDDDIAEVDLVLPAVTIAKTVTLGTTCPGTESVSGQSGTPITYCFLVSNTGDTALADVTVTDNDVSPPVSINLGLLPFGGETNVSVASTIQGDLLNTASVIGTPAESDGTPLPGVPEPTDDDTASVDQVGPGIQIFKTVYRGHDSGASCAGAELVSGQNDEDVTYCLVVVNTGDTVLSGVSITDVDLGLNIALGILPVGGVATEFVETVISGDLVNNADVTGTPSDAGGTPIPGQSPVTDDDTAEVDEIDPVIGLAKDVDTVMNNGDGTYTVTFLFNVENLGDVVVSDLVLVDDITSQFSALSPTGFSTMDGSLLANPAWDGTASTSILAPGQSLPPMGMGDVFATFTVTPGAILAETNTATVAGLDPNGLMVDDVSNDGLSPDPDGNGDPEEDEPTPVPFGEMPVIGLAKDLVENVNNNNGTYTITFELTVQNLGDVLLSDLELYDDIIAEFPGLNPVNFVASNGSLTASSTWDGTATSNILAPGQAIEVGDTENVFVTFTVTPGATTAEDNLATVQGTSPAGTDVVDTSTDGVNADPDGNGDPEEMDPTPVNFVEDPIIGLAKDLFTVVNNNDGTYTVTFELTAENLGDVPLSNIVLTDDIVGQFAGLNPTGFSTANGIFTGSMTWDGTANSNILAPGQSLAVGAVGDVFLTFTVTPGAITSVDNIANAAGTSPAGTTVTDISTDGINPDPDGNGNPNEEVPTPTPFGEAPDIGLAKRATLVLNNNDGTYDVTFEMTVENLGNVPLADLAIFDDIFTEFPGMSPTGFSTADGSLVGSPSWDGTATSNILAPGQSLPVGGLGNVFVTFTVTPGAITAEDNNATTEGTSPQGTVVTDTSTDGLNPDPNDDGNPEEEVPTPVEFSEDPIIGLAKAVNTIVNNNDGTFTVTYLFNFENLGNVPLTDLVLTDDIVTQFAGLNPTAFGTTDGSYLASGTWDGTATSNLLAPGQTLPVGSNGTVFAAFTVTPGMVTTVDNTATITGTSPANEMVSDVSNDGINPDPDDDGDPQEDNPTPTPFVEDPSIGLAKDLFAVTNNMDGSYTVTYEFTVQNLGTVPLTDIGVFDDIVGQFGALMPSGYSTTAGTLIDSGTWDGTALSSIVAPGQSLAVNESKNVFATFTLIPGNNSLIENLATTVGTSPAGTEVTDASTDGLSPDPNGDGAPDENIPTPTPFPENPVIGLAKSLVSNVNNNDGTYTVTFLLNVANLGDVPLSDIVITDDIIAEFPGMSPTGFVATDGSLPANPTWDGTATSNILAPGQSLIVGASGDVSVTFTVTPGSTTAEDNNATAEGTSPQGTPVFDTSTDGVSPDPNGDGDPEEMVPTPVPFASVPVIGLAKDLVSSVNNSNGTYTVTFELNVENLGDIPLSMLAVYDDIVTQFAGLNPVGFAATSGSLNAASAWDGTAASNILAPGQSMAVGGAGNVFVTFTVTPGSVVSVDNLATAEGTSPSGVIVMDTSTDGVDSDPNGDGNPNEAEPTPVPFAAQPVIGLAKDLVSSVNNNDGTYTVTFELNVANLGDISLNQLAVYDDIVTQFAGLNPVGFAAANGSLNASTNWDGTATSNILAPGQSLAVNGAGNVLVSFTVTPGSVTSVDNLATAEGTSPSGVTVMDTSTDGLAPDPNGDGNPNEAEPTPVPFASQPVIGLAKNLTNAVNNNNGTYTITFEFNVDNLGDIPLNSLELYDDIISQFAGLNPVGFSAANGSLNASTTWDGTATSNILAPGQSLPVGGSGNVSVTFTVTPGSVTAVDNLATVEGTSPSGIEVVDTSTDGLDSDPNDDGDPEEMTPTPVPFTEQPLIGLAKDLFTVVNNNDGSYTITFELTAENLGDTPLADIVLLDDILGQFAAMNPTGFSTANGIFMANPDWDGSATSNVILPGQGLAVGEVADVFLTFTVTPGAITTIDNLATAAGTSPAGTTVMDISTDGTNPDPNGDGTPEEEVPTPVPFGEAPVIGLSKDATLVVNNNDGTYTITMLLTIENFGNVPLSDLAIFDDIFTEFPGMSPTGFMTVDGSLLGNTAWDGTATSNILAPGQTLAVNGVADVSIIFDVTPGAATAEDNLATTQGTSPQGTVVTDTSTDGLNPDPNDDGTPAEMIPTPVEFSEDPIVGLAKAVDTVVNNNDGTYTVTYLFTVQNLGNVPLANLVLVDDVVTLFTGLSPTGFGTTDGTLIGNPTWDGTATSNLLQPGQLLPVGGSGDMKATFTVTPGTVTSVDNVAVVTGDSPAGTTVRDDSTNGINPDPDDNGDPSENDPTPTPFTEQPKIGLAKDLVNVINNENGSYTVTYEFTAQNIGTVPLNSVAIYDDIVGQFGSLNPTAYSTAAGTFTNNPAWDGTDASSVIAAGQTLAVGESKNVFATFTLTPGGNRLIENLATTSALSPAGEEVTDASTDGLVPDPNGDGEPDENVPTPTPFPENPEITVGKTLVGVTESDGVYTVSFLFGLLNSGDVPLSNLVLVDDIISQYAGLSPSNFRATNGTLQGNPAWDGSATSNILAPGQGLLVGDLQTVNIAFDVLPTMPGLVPNQATGTGTSPQGTPVNDLSNSGAPVPGRDDFTDTPFVLNSIGNSLFNDANNNGIFDPGEAAFGGVSIQLLDASGTVVQTTISTSDGEYLFDGIPAGTYSVFVPPSNFAPGGPLEGALSSPVTELNVNADQDLNDNGLDDPTPELNGIATSPFILSLGGEPTNEPTGPLGPGVSPDENGNLTVDLGFWQPGSIGDTVWNDVNADGVPDEALNVFGIDNVEVELYLVNADGSETLIDSQVTGAEGSYLFDGLPPGTYRTQVMADDFPFELRLQTTPLTYTIELGPGEQFEDSDFGFTSLPTAIELEYFVADLTATGVTLTWATAWERNSLGYFVYRVAADGSHTKVNETLILAMGGGTEYSLEIPGATGGRFILEEIETNLDTKIQSIVAYTRIAAAPVGEPTYTALAENEGASFVSHADYNSYLIGGFERAPQVLDITDPENPLELVGEILVTDAGHGAYFSVKPDREVVIQEREVIEEESE